MKTILAVWSVGCIVMLSSTAVIVAYNYCYSNCGILKHELCGVTTCEETYCEENEPDYEWRSSVLAVHNKLRMYVAEGQETRNGNSAASDMRALSYDLELELVAACVLYKHGIGIRKCIDTVKFFLVGVNVLSSDVLDPCTEQTIMASINIWYDEVKNVNQKLLDKYPARRAQVTNFSRFTQLVWARTTHVGCARCRKGNTFMMMCLYGPSGNMPYRPTYQHGSPTTDCGNGTLANLQYPSLCGESTLPVNATHPGLQMDFLRRNSTYRYLCSVPLVTTVMLLLDVVWTRALSTQLWIR